MTELDDPLEYLIDMLLETTEEEIERREEGREPLAGHDPDHRSDAKNEILSSVGLYREFCLLTLERTTKPDPDLERTIRDDDPNLIRTERALAPGIQHKWLERLERKVLGLRDLLNDVNWATEVDLESAGSEGIVKDMIAKLDQMGTAAKAVAAKVKPKTRGGRVRKMNPWLLVWLCIETFEMYGKKISTDEGSKFRDYVPRIHQLATGDATPEGDPTLQFERAIKDVVKIRRTSKKAPDFYMGRY